MNLSAPFINRPIATTLLSIGLALAGALGFLLLPVSPMPQIEFPTIIVQASLPGASPEIMASSVATPIERQLSKIAGITDMNSSSSLGSTRIIIQFDLSRNIDGAARDVQGAINASLANLPSNLPSNPTYLKVNPSDTPILIIALTSDNYTIDKLYDYASTQLAQRVLKIDGVGQVIVGGSSLPAVRIDLDLAKINQYNIGINEVKKIINESNVNLALGQITDNVSKYEIAINDQLFDAKEYGSLIVSYKDNKPLRLSDIANVKNSLQDSRNSGLYNGKPTVALIIFKEPGANVIDTVDRIGTSIPNLKSMIPANINLDVVMDRTVTIKAALRDVEKTLLTSMILVVLVVYFFLHDIRAMLIPTVAMTLSLLGTFAVIKLLGFSLNNLSLMALTIATGFVVDDAIVVLENISRHIEMGISPKKSALMGAKEIGFTVTSMSISLIAIFIPILLMGGIVGRLFHEFAITLSIAILISLIISLTLTPMMCAKFLKAKPHLEVKEGTLQRFYAKTLTWSLNHQKLMLVITIITIILSLYLFAFISKGFFPQQDTGRINATIVADQDISFTSLKKIFANYVDIIKKDPAVQNVVGIIGSGSSNSGSLFITLSDLEERKISSDMIINRLRNKLKEVAGATLYMQSAQDILVGGRQGNTQFQYTISADTIGDVNKYTPLIMKKLSTVKNIIDINSDQRDHGLQVFVNVNYDKAAQLGITAQMVDATLYTSFGQSLASTIYKDMNQYYVVLELDTKYSQHPQFLNEVYIKSTTGKLVPLAQIATFENRSSLLSINHQGLSPSATISFNLSAGTPLGDAVSIVDSTVKEMVLAPGIRYSFRGTAQAFQDSLKNEPYLILAALVSVYIVLGMLYESLIHPVTILSCLPSAAIGALLALLITKTELTIIALIGIILLIGIVKKNAIMMIDFVVSIQKQGNITPRDAIYQSALLRFRPIMMTTMAALFGAIPLALSYGIGSEMRRPLGVVIIGGLVFSQILTLYTTPVIYLFMERLKTKLTNR